MTTKTKDYYESVRQETITMMLVSLAQKASELDGAARGTKRYNQDVKPFSINTAAEISHHIRTALDAIGKAMEHLDKAEAVARLASRK